MSKTTPPITRRSESYKDAHPQQVQAQFQQFDTQQQQQQHPVPTEMVVQHYDKHRHITPGSLSPSSKASEQQLVQFQQETVQPQQMQQQATIQDQLHEVEAQFQQKFDTQQKHIEALELRADQSRFGPAPSATLPASSASHRRALPHHCSPTGYSWLPCAPAPVA